MSHSLSLVATLARLALRSHTALRTATRLKSAAVGLQSSKLRPAHSGISSGNTLSRRHFHITHPSMADSSKSKSESEWRAILNPEQVREAIT